MPEVTLEAPDMSRDHCLSTIVRAVTKLSSARFISGDSEKEDVKLAVVMEEEGYPLRG